MGTRADRGAGVLVDVVLPERYEPIRRIARGGMATVWCAHDRTLDRRVAIKLLAERYANDEVAGRRFKREARAAARLSGHPIVVTIYDVGQAGTDADSMGRPFLVMEFLSGGTVADALRTRNLDRPAALRWLQQAAEALDYAHRRGVIHRDVKLANFLLDRDRVLHVADYGIAQLGSEDTLTVSGEVLGTAAYLAPERALGQPATEASDRYALSVAAFELLVGERPFTAEHFAAQARQHVEEPPPLASRRNRALPPALDPVLTRGMAKHPEERFGSAGELAGAIEQALSQPHARRPATVAAAGSAAVAAASPEAVAAAHPKAAAAYPKASAASATTPADATLTTRALPAGGRALPAAGGGFRGRIAALAALAAVALAIGIAAAVNTGGGRPAGATAHTHSHGHPYVASRPTSPASPQPPATTRPATPTKPPQTTPTPAPPQPTGADALEARGYQLMLDGNYGAAIPVLRQAVAAATRSSLTYAYALYNLGRSLRLAGDPRAAVPILWQRLQIPNQTATVKAELTLALQALGQRVGGGAAPAPGGHHHGGGGPAPALDGQPAPAA